MKTIIAFIFSFIPLLAFAGGTSWNFEIIDLQIRNEEQAKITMRLLDDEKYFPFQCKTITVELKYQPEIIFKKTWSKEIVTSAKHKLAMKYLLDSYNLKKHIRFGSMGTGLIQVDGKDDCLFSSRGLTILEEGEGKIAVYSFHNSI